MKNKISVRGAKLHNLKNIDIDLPKNELVVVTWVSWSWKSTLAFDTIYAEGQRRYMESLSSYARQFLQVADKPEVDEITGLSPAISIDQKTVSRNPRSTVWTTTEIYDYLRLLYAKVWKAHCPECQKEISKKSASQIIDEIAAMEEGSRIMIMAPVVKWEKGSHIKTLERIEKDWFIRFRVDWELKTVADEIELDDKEKHDIEIVVDRIAIKDMWEKFTETSNWERFQEVNPNRTRLADSVELALQHWEGFVYVLNADTKELTKFSERYFCEDHNEINFPEIEPRSFSFNSPDWACEKCHWLGHVLEIDESLVIPSWDLTIAEWAINPWASYDIEKNVNFKILSEVGKKHKFDFKTPWDKISKANRNLILHWTWEEKYNVEMENEGFSWKMSLKFSWVVGYLEKRYSNSASEFSKSNVERYMSTAICPACKGQRLRPEILSVKLAWKNIIDATQLSIEKAKEFFDELEKNLSGFDKKIADKIIKDVSQRLSFLIEVWVPYLTLDRSATTLSGWESQRIRLATQIWSALEWVLYVLDEPSVWLHQKDNERLIKTMRDLQSIWNSVLVVEHDEDTMRAADYIVEIWPKAWKHGWKLVAEWTYDEIVKNPNSDTWKWLSWEKQIELPKERRKWNWNFIEVIWATANNLKNVDLKIPLWTFTWVTWVSGSGKSSLINWILWPYLANKLNKAKQPVLPHKEILWEEHLDKIIRIDQSPIWRTPKSNPATYTWVFTQVRDLFAQQPDAKMRGYWSWRFSFNVKWGRCESCQWDWVKKIEMHFLPDVYVPCDSCHWKRYNRETLEVTYRWKNISDVLEMTVSEALEFFKAVPKIKKYLETLERVWLGYIHLGQPATQLSGWEAQRVKLATELSKTQTWKTIYVLDEPTTGLHFDDIKKLLEVLQSLVDKGNTVIAIEHNLDVAKVCDYLVDVWPHGWDKGWEIVWTWTPEEVTKCERSFTGEFLKKLV
jgi:excinuclease ABC subunit A